MPLANSWQVPRLVHSSLEDSTRSKFTSSIVNKALEMLPQLIAQCETVHEEANGLMVAFKPATKDSSLAFMKRIRFIFQKSRINALRSLLDGSKGTLNLLLVTLNIEVAKSKSADQRLIYVYQPQFPMDNIYLGIRRD